MLFVKNLVFLDGAIARLAPDLDIFGEIASISIYFATHHGDRIAADVGIDPRGIELDMTGVKASFGLDDPPEGLTHRELQQRRETIRRNLSQRRTGRVRLASPAMRLVVARCSVDYAGRLDAHLPLAPRLIMVKADGCVAVHADGGAYKPLNWMNAPNTVTESVDDGGHAVWTVRSPKGETLTITLHDVVSDTSHDLGVDPGLVEGRRRVPPAGAAGRQLRCHRPRAASRPPGVPDRHRPRRPAVPRRRGERRRHRDQAPRGDRRRRTAGALPRVPRARPHAPPGAGRLRRPADQAAGTGAGRHSATSPASRSTTTCCGASSPMPCGCSSAG